MEGVEIKKNEKLYYVDFESMRVEAESREAVYNIVIERFINGEFPEIVLVEKIQRPLLRGFT